MEADGGTVARRTCLFLDRGIVPVLWLKARGGVNPIFGVKNKVELAL